MAAIDGWKIGEMGKRRQGRKLKTLTEKASNAAIFFGYLVDSIGDNTKKSHKCECKKGRAISK